MGRAVGLDLSIVQAGVVGSVVLFVVTALLGAAWLGLAWHEALVFGVLVLTLHWLSETVHQFGHALAARQTGYPMLGIRFGTLGLLSTAVYPAGEPALPGTTHIHRALGGPKASVVFSALAALILAGTWNSTPLLRFGALFFFLDNLFVLTLGALLPLGFTDGSTILRWRARPHAEHRR